MPAWDISASEAMRAPLTAWLAASETIRVTTASPTRAGQGAISCCITMPGDASGFRQPAACHRAAQPNAAAIPHRAAGRLVRVGLRRTRLPFAGAYRAPPFCRGREHVVVHPDYHRNKNDRVIEQVQLDARNHQLQHAERDRFPPEIMVHGGLRNQQQMLDMVPELDHQGDRPPGP